MMITKKLLQDAQNIQSYIMNIRRSIHQHAEVGFELKKTVSFVKDKLLEIGLTPINCGHSGIVVHIEGKKPGKVILLRADMDALAIQEEANVEFASHNGNMHACGHDMHTAMLLGAAQLLKKYEHEIEGTVKLMFQPAEEIFEGAHNMIEDGLLKNPKVDAALMIHVMASIPLPSGMVIVSSPGVGAPAADYFEITVQGKGCHGAMPNTGIDPLLVAANIVIALQTISSRELAMNEEVALTIGTMQAGAVANAIPDSVTMKGSIRTFNERTRTFVKKRLVEIVEGIARTFRADAVVEFGSGCPTLVNDQQLSTCASEYLKDLLGSEYVITTSDIKKNKDEESTQAAGSEDFAYVSQEVPSIMLALAAGRPEEGYLYPQHHPRVTFDERVLSSGSAIYAYMALRWLKDHKE